jgi:hypothetical protein
LQRREGFLKLSQKPSKPTDWTCYSHSPDVGDHDAWSNLLIENLPSPNFGGAKGDDDDDDPDNDDNEDAEVGVF